MKAHASGVSIHHNMSKSIHMISSMLYLVVLINWQSTRFTCQPSTNFILPNTVSNTHNFTHQLHSKSRQKMINTRQQPTFSHQGMPSGTTLACTMEANALLTSFTRQWYRAFGSLPPILRGLWSGGMASILAKHDSSHPHRGSSSPGGKYPTCEHVSTSTLK